VAVRVRRCGKTTLRRLATDDLSQLRFTQREDMVGDPQVFFRGCAKPVVVFDEIHQLRDPARVLKIGADVFRNCGYWRRVPRRWRRARSFAIR